jgi:transketolase
MRNALVSLLLEDATSDPEMVFMTGDLGFSVVEPLQDLLGDRFVNAGVSEANMISMAGAMAADGFHVYAYSIAPFITLRCYEQLRNDVCYGNRPVRLIGIGAGYSYGTLGPSHHSLEDASVMAQLPGMQVVSPGTESELVAAHRALGAWDRPRYYRIPRESGPYIDCPDFDLSKAAIEYRAGDDAVIVASGPSISLCLEAADVLAGVGLSVGVVSFPLLSPFAEDYAQSLLGARPVVTVFEGFVGNPLEISILALSAERRIGPVARINAGRDFATEVGSTEHLRARAGLTVENISVVAKDLIGRGTTKGNI